MISSSIDPPWLVPPDSVNLAGQNRTNVTEDVPDIVLIPSSGRYRMYYHRPVSYCISWDIYGACTGYSSYSAIFYRDTSDTNPPAANCSNCGGEQNLGVGGPTNSAQARYPEVIRLSDNKYRLYYDYWNGAYWRLTYQETVDTVPPVVRSGTNYENTSASIIKSGAWTTAADASASGGSYIYSNTTNNYAELTFTGNGVSWIGLKSNNQGIARVYLDGVLQGNVDLYRFVGCINCCTIYGACITYQYTAYQQTLWSISGLAYGTHTIRIVVSGTKNASSSNYYVNVDRLDATITNPNNMGNRVFIGTGASATDQASGPEVFQFPAGGYRLYYSYYNGTSWQLAYKDTTDINPPQSGCSNCGARQLMNISSGLTPEVVRLSSGRYRIYYSVNGSLAYRDTIDTNLPSTAANLTPVAYLSTGGSTQYAPEIIQLSSGKYRVYYGDYYACAWGAYGVVTAYCWNISFNETSAAATGQYFIGPSLALASGNRPRVSAWNSSYLYYYYCEADCLNPASWGSIFVDSPGNWASTGMGAPVVHRIKFVGQPPARVL